MISKSFFKSSFIYTVFGALPLASSIILLPFFADSLSLTDFGTLSIYISFTLLMQIVVNYAFDASAMFYYFDFKNDETKLKEFLGSVVISLLITGVFWCLVMSFIGNLIFKQILHIQASSFFPYGFMCVITAIFNSFFKTYNNTLISQQKPYQYLWSNLFNFILTISISLIGLYLYPHTLVGPMYGRLLSGLGIFIWAFISLYRSFGLTINFQLLKKTLSFNHYMYIQGILLWLLSYMNYYIINYFMPVSQVAIYDIAVKCTLFTDFAMTGINNAIAPKVFSIWKDNTDENGEIQSVSLVNKYYHVYTALVILFVASTIFIIPLIIPFVVKNKLFYASFQYVPFIAVSAVFKVILFMSSHFLLYFKKSKTTLFIYFCSTIIRLVVGCLLIQHIGIFGVIATLFIGGTLEAFLYYKKAKLLVDFSFNKTKMIFLPVLYVIVVLALQPLIQVFNYTLISFVEFLAGILLVLIIYKKELFQVLPLLLKKGKN